MENNKENNTKHKIKVINIGLPGFYEEVVNQGVKAVQLDWRPPFKQSEEIRKLLDLFL